MIDFLKPTKDKIIFTLVIPSYLFVAIDFLNKGTTVWWLPLPIILFIIVLFYIIFAGVYQSELNYLLQKVQQEQLSQQTTLIRAFIMLIGLAAPFIFNYLLACLFFRWYYSRGQEEDYLDANNPKMKRQIKKSYAEYKAGKARPAEELLKEFCGQ